MYRIKNLTNAPYDIKTVGGGVDRLPARGEIVANIEPLLLPHYKAVQYFEITEATDVVAAIDEAKPAFDNDLDALRAEYERLTGERPDGRWKETRLRDEVDALG